MGLLDFVNSDDARLGIGLLAAAGPSAQPVGFGQRLQGALGAFDDYKKDKARMGLFDTQAQVGLLTLDKAKRENAVQQQMTDAARQFYHSPQEAEALSMGPGAPQVKPGFDLAGYGTKLFEIDPLKALSFQQALAKDSPFSKVDPKDYTPESVRAFAASGGRDFTQLKPRSKMEVGPGGQVYDPYGVQPGQTLVDPNKPFSVVDNRLVPNTPYQNYEINKAGAGAARINVNSDKSYFGNVAEGLAKNDVALIDAARSAPDRISSARRVKEVLARNPITGTAAEARLSFNKAFATAGLIDGKTVADTETLASNLASQTLDAIKTSGLGAGQGFTDKDRQFLERAKSGNIEMNAESLRRLADLNENAALVSIRRGNAIINKLRNSPEAGQFGKQLDPIEEPAPAKVVPAGQAFSSMPPANPGNKGRFLTDQETGKRYQSNGLQWVEVK